MKIYENCNVITMDPGMPKADSFAVIDGRFHLVGDRSKMEGCIKDGVETVDLKGRTVIPGLIETHNHISFYAANLTQVDCRPDVNAGIKELMGKFAEQAKGRSENEWVQGWGYDDTLISDQRHLTVDDLDAVCPDSPVLIMHVTAHLGYVNSKALALAGVTPDTPDPSGGWIHHDASGRLSGLLIEPAAVELVRAHVPVLNVAEMKGALTRAFQYYHQNGVTSTHDGAIGYSGDGREVIAAYRELEAEGRLNLRVYMTIVYNAYDRLIEIGLGNGMGSDLLKIGSVKMFQDGSIQAVTAALTQDYHCEPGQKGDLIFPQEALEAMVEKYHSAGLQLAIHANGDGAIESVLTALEKAAKKCPRADTRHMIIHCQMASPDQIRRIKALGAIPSFFVNHVYYWGDRHLKLFLGRDRAERIDPLRSSLDEGLNFSLHSDLPVTPLSPIFSIHNAVNRVTRDGVVLGPEQRITPLEALKAYTVDAAACSFEDDRKGAIKDGYLADFVVLSADPLAVEPGGIKDIEVLATVVGGTKVYGGF